MFPHGSHQTAEEHVQREATHRDCYHARVLSVDVDGSFLVEEEVASVVVCCDSVPGNDVVLSLLYSLCKGCGEEMLRVLSWIVLLEILRV